MPWNEGAEKGFKKAMRAEKASPRKKARRLARNRVARGMRGDLEAMGVNSRLLKPRKAARGRARRNKR